MLNLPIQLLLALTLFQPAPPQAKPAATAPAAPPVLEITVERKRNGKIETMLPGHVFETGDSVRLRMKSHYTGFLYVMDQGTSGQYTTVFPTPEAGSNNKLQTDGAYVLPSGDDDWFEITGPAGFDVLYFLLSPTELARPAATAFAAPGPLSSLKPRCNDKIFRARGECIDDTAGPAALPPGQAVPEPIAPMAGAASRDIVFNKKKTGAVDVSGNSASPMLYTFRLAHK